MFNRVMRHRMPVVLAAGAVALLLATSVAGAAKLKRQNLTQLISRSRK